MTDFNRRTTEIFIWVMGLHPDSQSSGSHQEHLVRPDKPIISTGDLESWSDQVLREAQKAHASPTFRPAPTSPLVFPERRRLLAAWLLLFLLPNRVSSGAATGGAPRLARLSVSARHSLPHSPPMNCHAAAWGRPFFPAAARPRPQSGEALQAPLASDSSPDYFDLASVPCLVLLARTCIR